MKRNKKKTLQNGNVMFQTMEEKQGKTHLLLSHFKNAVHIMNYYVSYFEIKVIWAK
jgi:hypothetical protein